MTSEPLRESERAVVDRVAAMSADDIADWLSRGFRAMVADDRAARPFGEVLVGFERGEDVSDDLAAVYYSLPYDAQMDFVKGLDAAFRRMDVRKAHDQRALIFVLRLGAKIQNARLLPLLTKKLFAEGDEATPEERKLRSVALDVAVELSATSSNATRNLQDIVHSNLFRSSAAATVLLALCSASPDDLMDHLFRLERQLVHVFGEAAAPAEDALRDRRALLLADLTDHAPDSVIGGVVEFALRNRTWRLAWLADVLLEAERLESLPEDEAGKNRELLRRLRTRRIQPMEEPDWVGQLRSPSPDIGQRKEDIATLEDDNPEGAEEIFQSMVGRLLRDDRSLAHLDADDRELLLADMFGGDEQ